MKPTATHQKLRGGYYTPTPIGQFLASWAIRTPHDRVLEPSCGNGELLCAAARELIARGASSSDVAKQLQGVEFEAAEVAKAQHRLSDMGVRLKPSAIRSGDFFEYAEEIIGTGDSLFGGGEVSAKPVIDAVIGNPPFIRYQNFLEVHRTRAFSLMNSIGMHPTRLTNAWVPFVAVSAALLNPHGRLAMVVPAELLQVSYTAELRLFLSQHFCRLMLVTFRELVFPDIQQEVVLLCAEKNGGTRTGINVVELDGMDDLARHRDEVVDVRAIKPMDHVREKWTQYFLNKREIGLLREVKKDDRLTKLGDLASIDVGVVTGLNEYFVLNHESKCSGKLNGYTRRIVTRSGHLKGIEFGERDWNGLVKNQQPAYLLDAPSVPPAKLPESLRRYVRLGEDRRYHLGYKCSIRKHWYIVPSVWQPDAFMLRQVHRYPKIVLNTSKATCTDTIHRVRLLNGTNGRHLAMAAINSATFAFSEVLGRSYGGGVLELEPREAEDLPIPMQGCERLDFEELDRLLASDRVEDALDRTDKVLLREDLGFSERDAKALRGIWAKLRDRRLNRKGRNRKQKAS